MEPKLQFWDCENWEFRFIIQNFEQFHSCTIRNSKRVTCIAYNRDWKNWRNSISLDEMRLYTTRLQSEIPHWFPAYETHLNEAPLRGCTSTLSLKWHWVCIIETLSTLLEFWYSVRGGSNLITRKFSKNFNNCHVGFSKNVYHHSEISWLSSQ